MDQLFDSFLTEHIHPFSGGSMADHTTSAGRATGECYHNLTTARYVTFICHPHEVVTGVVQSECMLLFHSSVAEAVLSLTAEENVKNADLEEALNFAPALQGLERWSIQQVAAYFSWGIFPRKSQDSTYEQREVTIRPHQGQPKKQRLVRRYSLSDDFIRDVHAFNALAGRPHPNLISLDSWACDPQVKFSYLLLPIKPRNLAAWIQDHTPDNPAHVMLKDRDLAVRMRAAHCLASAVVHLYDNGLSPRNLSVSKSCEIAILLMMMVEYLFIC